MLQTQGIAHRTPAGAVKALTAAQPTRLAPRSGARTVAFPRPHAPHRCAIVAQAMNATVVNAAGEAAEGGKGPGLGYAFFPSLASERR
jgi:hypothetical protein